MSPDTQQNIFYTVYFLLSHNWQPLLYFGGLCLSFLMGFVHPTRGKILLIGGFALLLFTFEYTKHIQDALVEQTRNSLITERQSVCIERAIHLALNRAIPIGFPILGWIAVIGGCISELTSRKKSYNET